MYLDDVLKYINVVLIYFTYDLHAHDMVKNCAKSYFFVEKCTKTYDLISCCNEVYVLTLLIIGVLSHT